MAILEAVVVAVVVVEIFEAEAVVAEVVEEVVDSIENLKVHRIVLLVSAVNFSFSSSMKDDLIIR